jgi:hypothetical protein
LTTDARPTRRASEGRPQVALVDLLDRLLAGGVVVAGEVTLSIADVDLVHLSLRALVSSTSTLMSSASERRLGPE